MLVENWAATRGISQERQGQEKRHMDISGDMHEEGKIADSLLSGRV